MVTWAEKEAAISALEKNGKVRVWDLIIAAQDPDHPCHGDFTWDIQAAAEERWHDQARALIRKCMFDVTFEEETRPTVKYTPAPDEHHSFMSVPKLKKHADVRADMSRELKMLIGQVSRVVGRAQAKTGVFGNKLAHKLERIKRDLEGLRSGIEE